MTAATQTIPADAHAALMAALLVAAGSTIGNRLTPLAGIPLTCAGFAFAWIAAVRARRPSAAVPPGAVYMWLTVIATFALNVGPPFEAPFWYEVVYRIPPGLAIPMIGVVAAGPRWARGLAIWSVVAATAAAVIAGPIAIPRPVIDVWALTQASGTALLHGTHPYTAAAPDIYGGAYDFGYTALVYPYMPLGLLFSVPALVTAGDYRFALVVAFPVAVVAARAAARRQGVSAELIDIAILALALLPWAYITAAGYMEPLMITVAAAFVYADAVPCSAAARSVVFMLLPALKQYVVAPILIFAAMRGVRAAAAGAAAAAATVLPFLIWNWHATLSGLTAIARQMRSPAAFRTDSISVTAELARVFDVRPDAWLGPLAQMAAGAVALAMLRREGTGGLLLASALSLLASFLIGTQAFINYYAFAAALLIYASLAFSARGART